MKLMPQVSLKFKLLVVLILLTTLTLGAYAFIVLRHFEADKIAYIFDSTVTHSRSTANLIRSEVEHWSEKISFYMRGFDHQQLQFHDYSSRSFRSDPFINNLTVLAYKDGQYQVANSITDSSRLDLSAEVYNQMVEEALAFRISIRQSSERSHIWLMALRFEVATARSEPLIVVAEGKNASFLAPFSRSEIQDLYLVSRAGSLVLNPMRPSYPMPGEKMKTVFQKSLEQLLATVAVAEITDEKQEEWLVSMAEVGVGELVVLSLLPKAKALASLYAIVKQSIIFLVLLLSLAVIVSVFSSSKLTTALKDLLEATRKVGRGELDTTIDIDTGDEIGGLAKGFNHMTTEIKRLLSETAEKARMESELNTARVVQSTLFPEDKLEEETVSLRGFYRPASECGGDWWFYSKIDGKVYLWIGDATGHGAPAALVTSAARSASEIVREFPELTLPQIMSLMNKAVYGVAKGEMMMTFFLACLDPETGNLEYCSASHDPPYLLRSDSKPVKRQAVEALMDSRGNRLGHKQDSEYESVQLKLHPGDRLVFYTDGVTELLNSAGDMWGERKFLSRVIKAFNENSDLDFAMDQIQEGIEEHRDGAHLEDDVTYFLLQFQEERRSAA